MSKILITGGNGQLASCIKDVAKEVSDHHFVFKSSEELDITSKSQIVLLFESEKPKFCINCAGYTAVDEAEANPEKAQNCNAIGARNLAEVCAEYKVKLVHISTDFVFGGDANIPYEEDDETNPLGVYAQSKLDGELAIKEVLKEHFILRTSWLYSEYGQNFVKTMLRLASEQDVLKVVIDQVGSPTYGGDFATTILEIIDKNTDKYGTYHYCNKGSTTWYEFAQKIFEMASLKTTILPITSEHYSAAARRPKYSALSTNKLERVFNLKIPKWQDSLKKCLAKLDVSRNASI